MYDYLIVRGYTVKKWYQSKIVGAMALQSVISILLLLQEWYAKGDFSVPGIIGIVIAALVVVLRIWFTDTAIAHKQP